MGLTIHFSLSLPAKTTAPDVRQKLGALRQVCLDLPFQEVGEMLEFKGEECDFKRRTQDDPLRWFLCQSDTMVHYKYDHSGKPVLAHAGENGSYCRDVLPEHIIGFSTYPGNGCEEANVGLSRFPQTITVENTRTCKNHRLPVEDGGGWQWHSFCKTQFANEHGLEHFLRCHLSVVAMLDAAKRLGFEVTVNDEGHYRDKRDVHALIKEIGSWDQLLAGFGGALKDAAGESGMTIESPIFNRKDFEQLEMQGQALLPPSWSKAVKSLVEATAAIKSKKTGN